MQFFDKITVVKQLFLLVQTQVHMSANNPLKYVVVYMLFKVTYTVKYGVSRSCMTFYHLLFD